MRLSDVIGSLEGVNAIEKLNGMLGDMRRIGFSYSIYGERLITLAKYEETVSIQEIAQKFFDAMPFATELKDRLACDDLRIKIEKLYQKSDEALPESYYSYLIGAMETFFWDEARSVISAPIPELHPRLSYYIFKPEEFWSCFPNDMPVRKIPEGFVASRKMLEQAVKAEGSL